MTSSIYSPDYSFLLEYHDQFRLGSCPLLAVASVAEQLQVVDVMGAALRLRHNMVDSEVLERESNSTAVTKALLLTEESVLMCLVWRQLTNVGALRDVGAVYQVVE